mmetsp:Transcript_38513/g.127132  ORF Transcript_38513/g.127132 Transcript_38513/m.127132 type:complete len:299 (+) Transcript_38513:476-1372(+)
MSIDVSRRVMAGDRGVALRPVGDAEAWSRPSFPSSLATSWVPVLPPRMVSAAVARRKALTAMTTRNFHASPVGAFGCCFRLANSRSAKTSTRLRTSSMARACARSSLPLRPRQRRSAGMVGALITSEPTTTPEVWRRTSEPVRLRPCSASVCSIERASARPTAPRSPPHEAATASRGEKPYPRRRSSGRSEKTAMNRMAMAATKVKPTRARSARSMPESWSRPAHSGFHESSTRSRQRPPMMRPASSKSAVLKSHSRKCQRCSSAARLQTSGHIKKAHSAPAQMIASTPETPRITSET